MSAWHDLMTELFAGGILATAGSKSHRRTDGASPLNWIGKRYMLYVKHIVALE